MQNNDFTRHSPSILVISAFYAATAFLKHSKKYDAAETSKFCAEARKLIFTMVAEELKAQKSMFKTQAFQSHLDRRLNSKKSGSSKDSSQSSSTKEKILNAY